MPHHGKGERIAFFKGQAGNVRIALAGEAEELRIAVDTQDATSRSHCLRDASRDRTCSTTDIQHCHAWVEGRREPAVIPFERASLKNLWIGSVRLAAHGAVSLDHDGRTKPTAEPAVS